MRIASSREIATTRASRSFDRMRVPAVVKAKKVLGEKPDADLDDLERQISEEAKQARSLLDELGGDPAPMGMVPSWLIEAFKESKGRILSLEETRKILSKCKTSLSDEIINERENGN